MTIDTFIRTLSTVNPWMLLAILAAPPAFAWGFSKTHEPGEAEVPPRNYVYSVLVYLVCVPGIFGATLTAYTLFFIRQNLLKVNLFVYFLPVVSMIFTLVIVGRQADWDSLPGVDRLYGLVLVLVISFGAALAIQKTRIWIFFGGSIGSLLIIALICFALLKWGSHLLFRPKTARPVPNRSVTTPPAKPASPKDAEAEMRRLKKKMGIRD